MWISVVQPGQKVSPGVHSAKTYIGEQRIEDYFQCSQHFSRTEDDQYINNVFSGALNQSFLIFVFDFRKYLPQIKN